MLIEKLGPEVPSIPPPPESVKGWPVIGEHVHRLWTTAATDMKAILIDVAPKLKPVGGKLVDIAGGVVFGLLQFIAAIIIAGFLFSPGPRLVDSLTAFARRILSDRGEEMVQLAGNTIRNVSRGVVGVALVQSFFAGLGFLVASVPAAGFLAFLVLLLGIIQIGPAILLIPIIIWSWLAMETTMSALAFTVYMLLVGLMDNVLKPIVMARGVATPMPVILIGVVGGTIAYGISGLFLGPILCRSSGHCSWPGSSKTARLRQAPSRVSLDDPLHCRSNHVFGSAARLIIEETREGEAADALGRGYFAQGAAVGAGYRNGYRTGRLKTAEGASDKIQIR